MKTRTHLQGILASIVVCVFASSVGSAAAPSVDATIEPSQISMGESAQLTITTSGSGTLSVPLPEVSGLEFRVVGQSRQFEMINGATMQSTSTIIRVTPEQPGVFTIPGLTPKSQPLVLRVDSGNGNGSSAPGGGAAPLPGGSNSAGVHLTPDGSAFVHLEMPKHDLYVGESVPVEIQVGMRDGFVASINGLPTLNSSDFTLNNLSRQPQHGGKVIDGKPFTVYTWRSLLAAVKPGTYSLSFETPMTVRVRTQPQRDSMLDDLLGDPFLQNIFGATVAKNITVSSPQAQIKVLPLPAQGKPPNFEGAVGSFKISTDISSPKNNAGDPLTLRLHVSGAGNFDRVESGMLSGDAEWKTYDPKATFSSTDPTGYHGVKTFEQPLIASQPGDQTIPALSFSFFDPETHRYETAHSSPLHVLVSPSTNGATNEPPPPVTAASTPAAESQSGLRPDHAVTPARVDTLVPPYFQPRFLGLPSVLALLFAGTWIELRRRERHANDKHRERERLRAQTMRTLQERMTAAAAAGDAAAFFSAARSALQQALSARWQFAPPEHITIAEVDTRFEGDDKSGIRQIFTLADEANYSQDELTTADFDRWTQLIHRQITVKAPS